MTSTHTCTRPRAKTRSAFTGLLFAVVLLTGGLLNAPAATAGPFLDEIVLGTLDHDGHDHSDESNTDGLVDGVSAQTHSGPPSANADFSGGDFVRTDFSDSNFRSADFVATTFTDLNLTDVVLDRGDFTNAVFTRVGFIDTSLDDTVFTDATFTTVGLDDALIDGANFSGATFDDTDFAFAEFTDVLFSGANFSNVDFEQAYIERSNFSDADFSNDGTTSFQAALVRGSIFDRADLRQVDFTDTQFRCILDPDETDPTGQSTLCPSFIEANFSGANLTAVLTAPAFTADRILFSNTNFRGADLTDAVFVRIAAPCLQTNDVLNTWECMTWGDDVAPGTVLDGTNILDRSDIRGTDMRNLTFNLGDFQDVLIAGARFTGSTFNETDFLRADTRCIQLDEDDDEVDVAAEQELCNFFDAAAAASLIVADGAIPETVAQADFRDATFNETSFVGSQLGNATFGDFDNDGEGANLTQVNFAGGDLSGTDFKDAIFTDVVLDGVTLGCNLSPDILADDCGECAIFTNVFQGQTAPTDDDYNIRMRSVDFSGLLGCSALRVADTQPDAINEPLIDTFNYVDLQSGSFSNTDVTAVNFTGAGLRAVNFGNATITGVNFDGADMSATDLREAVTPCDGTGCASFEGTDFTGALLSGTAFVHVPAGADEPDEAITANFDDAIFNSATALGATFTGASFEDADTDGTGATFIGSALSASNFDKASFTNADLTGTQAICLPENGEDICASFVDAVFTDSSLVNVNFTGAILTDTDFTNSDLTGANFTDAVIDNMTTLTGSQIDGLNLTGVNLDEADVNFFSGKANFVPDPDLEQDASDAQGVELGGADLTGFNFTGLELRNWNFNGVTLAGTNFTGADLNGAEFPGTPFDEVFGSLIVSTDFFSGANLTGADLQRLELGGYDLSGANLTDVTVRSTNFTNADLSNTTLVDLTNPCEIDDPTDCVEFTGATLSCAEIDGTDISLWIVKDVSDVVQGTTEFFQYTDSNISGIQLVEQDLAGYNFSDLNLTRADFNTSQLQLANFTNADISGIHLRDADLCDSNGNTGCAIFSETIFSSSSDCDAQLAADLSVIDFSGLPVGYLDNAAAGDNVECVNFSGSDLSYTDETQTTGFDFGAFSEWSGAVLAGSFLRHQDFNATTDPSLLGFFQQLGHADVRVDTCPDSLLPVALPDDEFPVNATPDLRGTVFRCADLTQQNFANTNLTSADFSRAIFAGAAVNFDGAELGSSDFSNVNFTTAGIATDLFQDIATVKVSEDSDLEVTDDDGVPYQSLVNTSWVQSNLTGLDLSHIDFSSANFDDATFDNADLTDAILDNVALCGAVLLGSQLEAACPLADHPDIACLSLTGAQLTGVSFQNVDFTDVFLEAGGPAGEYFQGVAGKDLSRTNFAGAELAGLNLNGFTFEEAILSNEEFCDSEDRCTSFERAIFRGSDENNLMNMSGLNFREASVAGADFTNVNLSGAAFAVVGDICTDDLLPTKCMTITGANTSLQNANFTDIDLRLIDFGTGATAVTNFAGASFRRASLEGLDLRERDFTGGNFDGANLTDTQLDGAILAGSGLATGCEIYDADLDDADGTPFVFCSTFDNATLCGTDGRGATFSGSFENVDANPALCSVPANFSNATFEDTSLATANFANTIFDGATFETSATLCTDEATCVNFTNASLIGATFAGIDFNAFPDDFFQQVAGRNLSEVDFTNTDLSGKDFADVNFRFANLSEADLRNADLSYAVFDDAEFALGGVTDGANCSLAGGGSRVDLRGADLSGADFSRASNFQRGCVRVDSETLYNLDTKFPAGFDLLGSITIPEPSNGLLEAAALVTLVSLVRRRRRSALAQVA